MPRVLVVDNDLPTLRALKKLLEYDGHTVVCASGSAPAVEALRREAFDAVLADLDLPACDGVEVARMVRELRPEACLYLWSASPHAQPALVSGACFVFAKPFDYDTLQAELLACRSCSDCRHAEQRHGRLHS